jgi:hypothetical protein
MRLEPQLLLLLLLPLPLPMDVVVAVIVAKVVVDEESTEMFSSHVVRNARVASQPLLCDSRVTVDFSSRSIIS